MHSMTGGQSSQQSGFIPLQQPVSTRLGMNVPFNSHHPALQDNYSMLNSSNYPQNLNTEEDNLYSLIAQLFNPNTREHALMELSNRRDQHEDLALILWHSYGVMSILLQEIIMVYPMLSPPTLTSNASTRVCNALALIQLVATHSKTRGYLIHAQIPLYMYPFLSTTSKTRPYDGLRLTSLGVIGAIVKSDSPEVINFIIKTDIIPLCLQIMETGTELCKVVATFIVHKVLYDDTGLAYICQTYDRFLAVTTVLAHMVNHLVEQPSLRLLKAVIRSYQRFSEYPVTREALRHLLPEPLRDATFSQVLKDDALAKRSLAQLLLNLSDNVVPTS